MTEIDYMALALEAAKEAEQRGEVPIGAVLVDGQTGEVLAQDGNRTIELSDPTAHAEIQVIRQAGQKVGAQRLSGCDVYVTLEPCPMCAAALSFARIRRLYFGAYDPKGGGVEHGGRFYEQPTCHHAPEVIGGVRERQAAEILKTFFQGKR